jgi:hypothetical protein
MEHKIPSSRYSRRQRRATELVLGVVTVSGKVQKRKYNTCPHDNTSKDKDKKGVLSLPVFSFAQTSLTLKNATVQPAQRKYCPVAPPASLFSTPAYHAPPNQLKTIEMKTYQQ